MPHLIETPCNVFISTSVAQASRAICDILATNVGIVRKACREGKCTTCVPGSIICVPPTEGGSRHRSRSRDIVCRSFWWAEGAAHHNGSRYRGLSLHAGPLLGRGGPVEDRQREPTGPPPNHYRKPHLGHDRLRLPQSCPTVSSLADAQRRQEGLTPQQMRQGTPLEAYQQHPCTPARHEEEERYHPGGSAVGA